MAKHKKVEGTGSAAIPVSASSSPLLSTTISLVLLQLFSRLFSFSLNQLLLRSTTPEALGVATIGFDVARDTGLFFIREGLRGAVIRTRSSSSSSKTTSARLIDQTLYLPALLSPLLILLFPLSTHVLTSSSSTRPPHFNLSLSLYILSAFLELLSERDYLESLRQWETLTSQRVRVEGFAVGVKALTTLAVVSQGAEQFALLAFGVGQAAYGFTLLVGLRWSTPRDGRQASILNLPKLPIGTEEGKQKQETSMARFDPELSSLGWALTKQSFIKQLLTEADKIAIGQLSTSRDQGGYAIALNYGESRASSQPMISKLKLSDSAGLKGSLIARILFQPLEESSRLYFSRHLSTTPSHSLLSSLLLLHTHLSLIFIFLVPPYIPALLHYLLGTRWSSSSAPQILSAYCFYLPFLAINGITEAYFQSLASQADLKKGSYWMGVCSIGFVIAVGVGAYFGADERGLIWANCLNMAMRIAFSLRFIWRDAKDVEGLRLRNWTPSLVTLLAFGIGGLVVRWSENKWIWKTYAGLLSHIGVGSGVGLVCLSVM